MNLLLRPVEPPPATAKRPSRARRTVVPRELEDDELLVWLIAAEN